MRRLSFALLTLLMAVLVVAGCPPMGALNARAEVDASQPVTGIAYGSDPRQQLDVYVPAKQSGPYPAVLFFSVAHGTLVREPIIDSRGRPWRRAACW
jgi:hypothetical protein